VALIRQLTLSSEAFPPVPGVSGPVVVSVTAVDARLWVAPVGTPRFVHGGWRDCGVVGQPQDDVLAQAVQDAWAAEWGM